MSPANNSAVRDERVPLRPKIVTRTGRFLRTDAPDPEPERRISDVYARGRELAAVMLKRVVREEETIVRIAGILGVSESLVKAWLDPDAKQQFPISALFALKLAGCDALAYATGDEVARHLRDSIASGRDPMAHIVAISRATGAAVIALCEAGDRSVRVHALRALGVAVSAAIADEQSRT